MSALETVISGQGAMLSRMLFLLVLLAVGVGLRVGGILDDHRVERLTAVAFYGALPALVFTSTYDQPLGELVSPSLILGLWFVLFSTAVLAWVIYRYRSLSSERRSVAVIQSYHTNVGFLGLPLVSMMFGAEVTAIASVILGIVSLTQAPLTVLFLVKMNGSDTSIRAELAELLRNPVLIALAVGIIVSTYSIRLPSASTASLDLISNLALPIALICVGASLPLDSLSFDFNVTGSIVGIKVCCMPVLAWLVFSVLGVSSPTFIAGVLMLAMPTAVSTFIYAGKLGGDAQFASVNILATTIVSITSLPFLFQFVG